VVFPEPERPLMMVSFMAAPRLCHTPHAGIHGQQRRGGGSDA